MSKPPCAPTCGSAALPPLYLAASIPERAVHPLVRREKRAGDGLARVGYRGVYDLPLLLYEDWRRNPPRRRSCSTRCSSAEVSWKRIKPMMKDRRRRLSRWRFRRRSAWRSAAFAFRYDGGAPIFEGVSFSAQPGDDHRRDRAGGLRQIHAGHARFCASSRTAGRVRIGGRELSRAHAARSAPSTVGYLGHDPELWNDTVENNVLLGETGDADEVSAHWSALDERGRARWRPGRHTDGGQRRRAAFRRSGAAAGAGADARRIRGRC